MRWILATNALFVIYCVWRYRQWQAAVGQVHKATLPANEFAGLADDVEAFFRK